MAFSIELINTNSKKFRLQEAECKNARYSMTSKFFKYSVPGAAAEDTVIVNLGRETTTAFPFFLRETTGDASGGTHSSTVKTVQEKVDYLKDTFITDGLDDLYTINIYTTAANILGLTGIIDNFSLEPTGEKPNVLPGNLTVVIGGGLQ